MEPEQLQQDQTLPSSYEASTTLQPPQIPKFKMPLGSISSVLNLQTIENHLDKLSREELSKLYKDYLPESTSKNVTKYKIIEIIRSGFYQQNEQKLSEHLKSGEGAGYLLSQSLKYDYKGEGIENFLNGIRDLGKKEQKEEENEGKDTEMN
ncbi:hypothetical protein KGF54_002757 [Candida jiufengensis]|uniref:uncharacterized protein n=1 Tax=Candida jiufengensis TaxID=497108 RepID=UPI002224894A|nr:uncharacterized protein KGF54_002757 [Candida jiufengensis]KAI5953385.1 hypothetical protein KGF54_002757 [Candida jiufengensis]